MALKVNVSTKAAAVFEDLPIGWYHWVIADGELTTPKEGDNHGKMMYRLTFEVTADPRNPVDENGAPEFLGRTMDVYACLWPEAIFTMVGIMRALGYEVTAGDMDVPDITDPDEREQLIGQTLMGRVGVQKKEQKLAREEKRKPRANLSSFKSEDDEEDDSAPAPKATGRRLI